jgi:CHAD domain-containing protein
MKRKSDKIRLKRNAGITPFISAQAGLLRKLIKKTRMRRTADRVHDLRVTVRRLRTALWLAGHDKEIPRFGALSKSLRNLGKILGGLRQLDVAIADAKYYRLPVGDLKARRKEARKAADVALAPKLGDVFYKKLGRLVRLLNEHDGGGAVKGASKLLERVETPKALARGSKAEFHRFRIFMKKVRYTIEAFGLQPGRVKTLHDRLGKAHDLEVLQRLVGKNDAVRKDEIMCRKRAAKIAGPAVRFARGRLAAVADATIRPRRAKNKRVPRKAPVFKKRPASVFNRL